MLAANVEYWCTSQEVKLSKTSLSHPMTKNKDPITKKSGVIYMCKCDKMESDEDYI